MAGGLQKKKREEAGVPSVKGVPAGKKKKVVKKKKM